ncbi:glycoside hydrolase family 13 protein [Acholeplasma vituli]|uniref:Glycoside hydrolase family 13 protein n=1 Tax=Paracholeplasma vituli TaxID=69473 RepID=A0ABT2PXE3_9MOLU|nr:glycoside hydrolase family 13 protein [Paracholeplasma vituli]MCU0105628.1 glycoside hydrolase family 13 protein [Paracholeplasma vituli]
MRKPWLYDERLKNPNMGRIVYQVILDRFVPSQKLKEKEALYAYPRKLKSWTETPKGGVFLEDVKYWSHELDFYGGDLESLMTKLDYLKELDIDMLYLNPIFESLSNHKYDATEYLKISEEYGTQEDLKRLAQSLHESNMRLILDGVFNHMGVGSTYFQNALDPNSPYRNWFDFNEAYPEGVRLWADAKSLPELNLENEAVKDYIYQKDTSVIKSYLKAGVDGFRLDVAFDIGYDILKELTTHAHQEKSTALIVGETWNYPKRWLNSMDGVMNFTLREITFGMVEGTFEPKTVNTLLEKMVTDCGIDGLLRSWNILDNHDTVRLNHRLNKENQALAEVLQFTFPGSPNLYYGSELGMTGGNDPENRAPMRWDLNTVENERLQWVKKLIQIHKQETALMVGDYLPISATKLVAFERYTDNVSDTVLVILNPTEASVTERMMVQDSSLMNYSKFDTLLGEAKQVSLIAGLLEVTLPKKGFVILKPRTQIEKSYTPYKRV